MSSRLLHTDCRFEASELLVVVYTVKCNIESDHSPNFKDTDPTISFERTRSKHLIIPIIIQRPFKSCMMCIYWISGWAFS